MDTVVELTYLIGAIAITHSLYGIARLIRHIAKSQPINFTHLCFSLLGPFIIWQHIFQFIEQVGKGQCITSPFLLSLAAMFSLCVLIGISLTLYPTRLTSYTTENDLFVNYLKESRRTFYFLITIYLVSILLNNFLLGVRPELAVTLSRLAIFMMACIGFLLNIESSKDYNTSVNLRVPYFVREQNQLGFDVQKETYLVRLFTLNDRNTSFNNWQYKIYGQLDMLIFITVFIGFLIIIITRNF